MDEMNVLEDLCAAVPPPEPQRLAAARAVVARQIAAETGGRRWRPTRRRIRGQARRLIPLAAAGAVAVIVVGLAVAAPLLRPASRQGTGQDGGNAGAAPGPAPAMPPFVVDAPGGFNPSIDSTLRVYAIATGAVVGTVSPPPGTMFSEVAALAGGRTFVAAASAITGQCRAALYEFSLNGQGQPGPLTSLHVTVPGEFNQGNDLSVTPDGRTIAYATALPGCYYDPSGGGNPPSDNPGEIGVINLATGQSRTWATSSSFTTSLALSADGRQLAFTQWNFASAPLTGTAQPSGQLAAGTVIRILPTSAPAGSADQYSTIVSQPAVAAWAALSDDATSLYACVVPAGASLGSATVKYYAENLADGRQQLLASFPGQQQGVCAASPDTSGSYLLIQLMNASDDNGPPRLAVISLRTGVLTSLPVGDFVGLAGTTASMAW
jgi:hypothetical protein